LSPFFLAWVAIVTSSSLPPHPQRGKDLNEIGLKALATRDYAAAERAMRESLRIWRALGRDYEPHSVVELMNLGDAMCAQGKWSEGEKLFAESLEVSRRALGPKHLLSVTASNRLANVKVLQGELDGAEPLFREVLAIERELYPLHIQTAHTLAGLGSLHARTNRLGEALAEVEEGLALTLRIEGENTIEAGMAYSNVAQVHRIAGRLDRALPLLRKARAAFERTVGPVHTRVGTVMSQEGLALMAENKLTLADQEMVAAIDVLTRSGATNVEMAVAQHNLALLRMRQKRYAEADRLLTTALALEEEYSVQPGSEMAATLQVLAQCRAKEHRVEDASRLKDRATAIEAYR
jgi:tetratricopeptide (TPR) repeat protein